MKEILILTEKVEQAGSRLSELAKELRAHDRRLTRLETFIEVAQINAGKAPLPPPGERRAHADSRQTTFSLSDSAD